MRHLYLDADNLGHKWGFSDGDILDDWWWEVYDEAPTVDTHDLLWDLVNEFLVPEIEKAGHIVELTHIQTNHNPVRLEKLNGVEVDWYSEKWELFTPTISVWVTKEQIEKLIAS